MSQNLNSLSQDSKKSVNDHAQNLIPINHLNPCEKAQDNDSIMEKKTEKIFSDELYKAMADLEVASYEVPLEAFKTSHLDETPTFREIFFWSFVALYFLDASVHIKNEDSRKEQKCNFWNTLVRIPRIYRARVLALVENSVKACLGKYDLGMSETAREEYIKGSFIVSPLRVMAFDNEEKIELYFSIGSFGNFLIGINDVKTACEIWDIDLDSICIEESPKLPGYEVSVKKGTELWDFYHSNCPLFKVSRFRDGLTTGLKIIEVDNSEEGPSVTIRYPDKGITFYGS